MLTYQQDIVKTSVRQLVEFLLREGDLISEGKIIADVEAMQEGTRIHKKIQKNQKVTYQSEVPLKTEWKQEDYTLVLEGRADGIDRKEEMVYVDEIKGMYQNVLEYEDVKPLHLAQAKCYAAMYLRQKKLEKIGVQITYCNIETKEIKRFYFEYEQEELENWFNEIIDSYKMWADYYVKAKKVCDKSIREIEFPYEYREGQKQMIAMVYQNILDRKSAFFQAPTGIGKTIATVYPSLKAMHYEHLERIFYLTAKTITRTVAQDTIQLLRKKGLQIKSITITAKEKICDNEIFECSPLKCEKARGHFDRINGAIFELLQVEGSIDREVILFFSRKHSVCPYELSFEAARWCDFIICDYNYVFDPHVNRIRLFSDSSQKNNVLLVDEAHNLVERAREMYSADLSEKELFRLYEYIPVKEKKLRRKVKSCITSLQKIKNAINEREVRENYVVLEDADYVYFPLFRLLPELLEYLTEHESFVHEEEVIQSFFQLKHFMGIMEGMTEGYRIYAIFQNKDFVVRLFCIDPSTKMRELTDQRRSTILFSATLLPMAYYKKLLYGQESAPAFQIASPFEKKNRLICIANDVTSRYKNRNTAEYQKIVQYLCSSIEIQKGNYMIFFPSYDMLEKVYLLAEESTLHLFADIVTQSHDMDEKEKEEFLGLFEEERKRSLIGFCVLGSVFSEGIDLTGKRLIGVLIVGTGLPKICQERDMIRSYFDTYDKKGYDYAYRFPGMNKVLQAAGRVIRTAQDVGIIVLMDQRFLQTENQYLLPEDWDYYYEVNRYTYPKVLKDFWSKIK